MLTLTQNRAEFTPSALRFTALLAISHGFTLDGLRSRSAGTAHEAVDKQIADEMNFLACCGFTGPVAAMMLAERDRVTRSARAYSAEAARREVRAVAESALRGKGPAAAAMFREIAARAAGRGDDEMRRSFTEFAQAAEELLAGGAR